jgi:hypothetical protein
MAKRTKEERNALIWEINFLYNKSGIRNPFHIASSLGTSAYFVSRVISGEVTYQK